MGSPLSLLQAEQSKCHQLLLLILVLKTLPYLGHPALDTLSIIQRPWHLLIDTELLMEYLCLVPSSTMTMSPVPDFTKIVPIPRKPFNITRSLPY